MIMNFQNETETSSSSLFLLLLSFSRRQFDERDAIDASDAN